jgi:glycosyltransferase involved in cell wall biosynthesis
MRLNHTPRLTDSDCYRIGFVVEQALGHKTHSQNLHKIFKQYPGIEARWILPEWQLGGLGQKIPLYRSNWTVQAGVQARRGLNKLRQEFPFEGLFFHTQVPAILASDWVRRYPSVISLDATPLQYDSLGDAYNHHADAAWLEKIKYGLNRRCFHAARHLVTWSQWAKDGLVRDYGVPSERITVVSPGINLKEWENPWDHPKNQTVVNILFVGGNFERKGGLELLRAFAALRETRSERSPAVNLHLVTQDAVTEQPNVYVYHNLRPNSAELKQLFYEADIFCLPTRGDCLPMALAEAGASSLPIVSTSVAGIPELVIEGKNGFLVQPEDVSALTQALKRLVEDAPLRNMMGGQSKEIVSNEHNLERNASRLIEIIQGVIDESRR